MSTDSKNHLAGDYRLVKLLLENEMSRVWLAEQSSIARTVLLEELLPDQAGRRDDFLADAKAKAAVDHPLIATVYEAVVDDERCFFVRECLSSRTLADIQQAGLAMPAARLARALRHVAEAQIHHQSAPHATTPLELRHIHVDENDVVRIENLAVAGSRPDGQSATDIKHLGKALRPLVADARPGATRMLTLLSWMRGEGIESPLDWRQVVDVCQQIEHQLSHPGGTLTPTVPIKRLSRMPRTLVAAGAVLGLIVILGFARYMRPNQSDQSSHPDAPDELILIPADKHPAPDGGTAPLEAFRISPAAVNIGQYRAFLEALETLAASGLERSFDHRQQPVGKTSHLPDNWQNQLKAPGHLPVVGVDWWDAHAYAEWKRGRLPTQEEWFAAVRNKNEPGRALLSVGTSIREWTRNAAADPANPLGGSKWVIIGLNRENGGAVVREWIDDRSLRRADLVFRVVFDAE